MSGEGRALRMLRDARGWTQEQLSDVLGRAQPEVSRWERGIRPIPQELLEDIARRLDVSVEAFGLASRALGPLAAAVHHRSYKSVSASRRRRWDARLTLVAIAVDQLTNGLVLETDFVVPDLPGADPEKAARLVRAAWRIQDGPIPELIPVLERAGIFVVPADFGSDRVVGMSTISPGGHVVFMMNREASSDRVRLTLGHELGHVVLHRDGLIDEDIEDQAYAFARHFLMPREEFSATVLRGQRDLGSFAHLKGYWRQSIASMMFHAHRLGLTSRIENERLNRQLSARGWRLEEPHPLAPEPAGTLLAELVTEVRAGGVPVSKIHQATKVLNPEQVADLVGHPWVAA